MTETDLLYQSRKALGYKQKAFSRFLGYNDEHVVRRWENGTTPIPVMLWRLLSFMLKEEGLSDLRDDVAAVIQTRREHG